MSGSSVRAVLVSGMVLALVAVACVQAETIQRSEVRIALDGGISPKRLPRTGAAAVNVSVKTKISSPDGKAPPQLRKIELAINRNGRLNPTGLPVCEISDIQPSTNEKALEACRGSLVGHGHFEAVVALSQRAAFPSSGKMLAFNGRYRGKPAILAHVYGDEPLPTSFTLPFVLGRGGGQFGTTLTAILPTDDGNSVTGIEMSLGRTFTYRGARRSYASAGCPAPAGSAIASFPFAKVSYVFRGGPTLASTLIRTCEARG